MRCEDKIWKSYFPTTYNFGKTLPWEKISGKSNASKSRWRKLTLPWDLTFIILRRSLSWESAIGRHSSSWSISSERTTLTRLAVAGQSDRLKGKRIENDGSSQPSKSFILCRWVNVYLFCLNTFSRWNKISFDETIFLEEQMKHAYMLFCPPLHTHRHLNSKKWSRSSAYWCDRRGIRSIVDHLTHLVVICRDRKLRPFAFFTFVQKVVIKTPEIGTKSPSKLVLAKDHYQNRWTIHRNGCLPESLVNREMYGRSFGLGLNLDLIR